MLRRSVIYGQQITSEYDEIVCVNRIYLSTPSFIEKVIKTFQSKVTSSVKLRKDYSHDVEHAYFFPKYLSNSFCVFFIGMNWILSHNVHRLSSLR